MMATAAAVAFIVFSCKSKLSEAQRLDLQHTPIQVVDSMYILQTKDGRVEMRVEAPIMERYDTDTMSFELFPQGLDVYGYAEDGQLQSTIHSENASHEKRKKDNEEIWKAFGNVVVRNILKMETMETDTIYWDRAKGEIYTDCYVRMYSPDGFMQGYGMRADDHARNAILRKPFNSYGVTVQDSTLVVIDSVNFIGAFPKNL